MEKLLKIDDKISLIKYNTNNDFHQKLLEKIKCDKEINSKVNLYRDNKYIISFENNNIGICIIGKAMYTKNAITISSGILKEYRGLGLGSQTLAKITEYFLKNTYIEKVILEIKPDNILAIKGAENAGYVIDSELLLKFEYEGYLHYPYVKQKVRKLG